MDKAKKYMTQEEKQFAKISICFAAIQIKYKTVCCYMDA